MRLMRLRTVIVLGLLQASLAIRRSPLASGDRSRDGRGRLERAGGRGRLERAGGDECDGAPDASSPAEDVLCDSRLPQFSQDFLCGHASHFRSYAKGLVVRGSRALKEMPAASCRAVREMLDRGLTWTALGMDFTGLFNKSASVDATIGEIEANVMPYFYPGCSVCANVMKMDNSIRWRPRSLSLDALGYFKRSDAERFRLDGFFRFDAFGVDVAKLRSQVSLKLGPSPIGMKPVSKGFRLEGLEPIVHNEQIKSLASYYFGTSAELTGYKVLRLGSRVTRDEYKSGYWHHDSCGTRLKLFVFLQDVTGGMVPTTEIAVGSQGTAYFGFGPSSITRYDDDYVHSHYRTERMTGLAGSGFIFDTNTVHIGNVEGQHAGRDVVIVEYSASDKIYQHVPAGGPCPEPETYHPDSY